MRAGLIGHRPGLAYAPYADLIWCETGTQPEEARRRRGDSRQISGKMLAYNCSPSFNWKKS